MQRMPAERITWEDVLQMPEDGNRYEAIGGVLHVTPAPSLRHQWISFNLGVALARALVDAGHGFVFDAPIGVEFPPTAEGVQPDLIFVSKARRDVMVKEGISGAPDLVIEILSPSTAARDRTLKKDLYERQGVAVYWLVDPEDESVEVWRFDTGAREPEVHSRALPIVIGDLDAGEIDLRTIFRAIE